MLSRERLDFYDRLKYTILDSEKEELDEILRTLIRKQNADQFYRELFDGCYIDSAGEIVRVGFFGGKENPGPLEYAMYTLLAYAPDDFPLKKNITSIRFIADESGPRQNLRFPRRLDFFPHLEQLGLVGWKTAAVPRELARCRRLRYLSLRNNRYAELPEPVMGIPNLTHLDISYNLLESLPEDLDRMKSLETLTLKGNRISRLPLSVKRMEALEYLDVSCNKLVEYPHFINDMAQLRFFNAAYNELSVEEEARLHVAASLP